MAAMGHGRSATNTAMYAMGLVWYPGVDFARYYEDITSKEKW